MAIIDDAFGDRDDWTVFFSEDGRDGIYLVAGPSIRGKIPDGMMGAMPLKEKQRVRFTGSGKVWQCLGDKLVEVAESGDGVDFSSEIAAIEESAAAVRSTMGELGGALEALIAKAGG